jgi:hypothetical protein
MIAKKREMLNYATELLSVKEKNSLSKISVDAMGVWALGIIFRSEFGFWVVVAWRGGGVDRSFVEFEVY